ncbi:Golgin subfamily A member 7/ERF4 family-domain-containing protein [Gigaspora rosea]|uniref:Ras modification protein ERF4 n=1 Tax=Gigaspora rosea TaxID=44941 RepID=A0A397UJM9_9GLOM|nr:Golgin subfamily A member 7/ERF4 family-domain-containing protein [Gigaspora rosea]
MFFKNENNIASDLQTSHNSDTDIEKHLSAISDDGVIADKESSGPSGKPIPLEVLSSNKSSSNLVTPKQIIRIERDYTRGEMCQFQSAFPLEIDGRINPRQFQQTINRLNELLSKAFNPKYNCFDNCLACVTIYLSTLCMRSHYDKTIEEICTFLDNENLTLYNLNGLNFRDPRKSSFLFVSFFANLLSYILVLLNYIILYYC